MSILEKAKIAHEENIKREEYWHKIGLQTDKEAFIRLMRNTLGVTITDDNLLWTLSNLPSYVEDDCQISLQHDSLYLMKYKGIVVYDKQCGIITAGRKILSLNHLYKIIKELNSDPKYNPDLRITRKIAKFVKRIFNIIVDKTHYEKHR